MLKRYEFFDHTADLGVVIFGTSPRDLMNNAIWTLLDLMSDTTTVSPTKQVDVQASGDTLDELLIDMLREIIFRHEADELCFASGEVTDMGETTISARLFGEPIDRRKHVLRNEIKNATYHGLEVSRSDDGLWRARVIFDV